MGVWARLGIAAAAGLLLTLPGSCPEAAPSGLRAGAAAVKITPSLTRPVYIAGYEINRVAESVRDDLWARVLVLDDGQTRFAVVALDLIGLTNARVRKLRARITAVPPENVLIACTHVHSGPDTMGLWGPVFGKSGVDPLYMQRLEDRIVVAVENAVRDMRPATIAAGGVEVPDGFVHNSREPIQDKRLTSLRLADDQNKTIGTVIHYGGHPEVNKTKAITSDFVHYVRQGVEERFGGTAVFVNGALGGMVTPKISKHNFEEMERVGKGVAASAIEATEKAEPQTGHRITIARKPVRIPLQNAIFQALLGSKVIDGELKDGMIDTEVWRVDLGRVCMVTIPGEILPKPALELKSRMPGRHRLVVALGNDELGYILDPDDFGTDRYKYERSMSVGKEAWPRLFDAAKDLLK
jgi:hypothetical protein